MKRILVTVLVVLLLEAGGAVVVRATGMMNVSAIPPPSALEDWFFGGMSDHSVEAHAKKITPIKHDDPALLKIGLEHYNENCVGCHGAPGMKASDVEQGLNPPPPHLWTDDSQSMTDAQMYWVVKNGIRMTGMPAFGPTHDEKELRGIVAFLRDLPKLKGGKYQALVRASGLEVPGEHEAEATPEGATPAPATDGGTPAAPSDAKTKK